MKNPKKTVARNAPDKVGNSPNNRLFRNVPPIDPELQKLLEKVPFEPTEKEKAMAFLEERCRPQPVAGPDNEVWVRDRVATAMRMALALERETMVGADSLTKDKAMRGVATGAAIEILRILNFDTQNLINLK